MRERRHVFGPGENEQPLLMSELRSFGWSQFIEAEANALRPHFHPGAYELCYIHRGQTSWWVGDELVDLRAGDCFLTWPDEVHGGVGGVMDQCELYWIIFPPPAQGTLGCSGLQMRRIS